MKNVFPDYYSDFSCIAGECRHSCCIGWEIDIDDDTAEYYRTIGGELGKRLAENIEDDGDSAHFILGEGDRCPFLNCEGLCDIYRELGEESLCRICTDHPRFVNCLSDRDEIGLGLCCEAAAELILTRTGNMKLITADDGGDEELSDFEKELLSKREEIFSAMCRSNMTFEERCEEALAVCGAALPEKSGGEWYEIFSALERLDSEWDIYLEEMSKRNSFDKAVPHELSECYTQLFNYFIYRHFAAAESIEDAASRVAFAALSCKITAAVCTAHNGGRYGIRELAEAARIYSSEIEYSEENTACLLELLG